MNSIDLIFNSKISSETISLILKTERGQNYYKSLVSIFRIIYRIFKTVITNFSIYNFDPIFLNELETFAQKWNNFLNDYFLDVKKFPIISTHKFNDNINALNNSKLCSICLCPENDDEDSVIVFFNFFYHTNCANFYLNRIGILLPKFC